MTTHSVFRTWFRLVTGAEIVGFAVPALVGGVTSDSPVAVTVPAMLAAGAVEGAVLGSGQAAVLRRVLPDLPRPRWIVATSVAATVAYGLGMLPSLTVGTWTRWPAPVIAGVGAILALALLGSIGGAQWLVLRHHVARAGRWVVATAVAWLGGLTVFILVATPLWQPGQSPAVVAVIGIGAGSLMAATAAAITGAALTRLIEAGPVATTERQT